MKRMDNCWIYGVTGSVIHCWWQNHFGTPARSTRTKHLPYASGILLLAMYQHRWVLMSSGRHVLTVTFKAALFEIANNWQLTKCLSMGEWTDKLVYYYDSIIPMMEYCLQGTYYNENILLHATTWLTLTQCWRKACRHKTMYYIILATWKSVGKMNPSWPKSGEWWLVCGVAHWRDLCCKCSVLIWVVMPWIFICKMPQNCTLKIWAL